MVLFTKSGYFIEQIYDITNTHNTAHTHTHALRAVLRQSYIESAAVLSLISATAQESGNVGERERTVFRFVICIKIRRTPTLTFNEVKVSSLFQQASEVQFERQIGLKKRGCDGMFSSV